MMSESKLSSRPPSIGRAQSSLDDFIGGASVHTAEPGVAVAPPPAPPATVPEPYTWAAPGVREDVSKVFNLRLPEPDLLKLKYIADHTPDSMQQFCLSVLLPAIKARIAELTGN